MPQVKDGPDALNATLEEAYQGCMKYSQDTEKCAKVAWSVAKGKGWHKVGSEWKPKGGKD